MNCFDVYKILDNALESYLDSIALLEDPTDNQRKEYELIKFWKPSSPDDKVEEILKSLVFSERNEQED